MKKSRTEIYHSNIIKFIPLINPNLSKRERKKEFEKKIELELKSNPKEFSKFLQKNLEKNEITKEIYLSKKISKDKKLQPNLLISKINNCEKMLIRKNKLLEKLSKENEQFLKKYRSIKTWQTKNGKMTDQLEYLNDVAQIYIAKDYDLNKCGINNNENIFKYSVLNDINFGNDVNNTVLRIIKEMGNNEFLREQKLIFDFQDELLKEKINNRIKHPAETLIKNIVKEEDDYGIDNICPIKRKKKNFDILNHTQDNKSEKKEINKEEKKGENKEEIMGENKEEINEENEEKHYEIVKENKKPRPSFLYLQMKSDIKKMQEKIINLDKIKSNYKNESLIKFQNNFKPKLSIILNSIDKKINSKEIIMNEIKEEGEKPVEIYNNTEILQDKRKSIKPILILNGNRRKTNKKITFIKNNLKRFSIQNKLPSINKSFGDIHKKFNPKSFNRTKTTNYSQDINTTQTNPETLQKTRNSKSFIINNGNQLLNNDLNLQKNDKIMRLTLPKKNKGIKISTLINEKIYKNPISKTEIKQSLENFRNKHENLYESFLNNAKESNLHGFTNNFQRITKEKNFGIVYNKNKYLKKNNFSHLMSNYDMVNDDDNNYEGVNIHKIDERIGNITYDSADYLLGSGSYVLNKNHI